jgi:hypothetical protein
MNFIPYRPSSPQLFTGILLVSALALLGCNPIPEVTSQESQRLIQRFYTACNTRSSERLEAAIQSYKQLMAQSKLRQAESENFDEIIRLAREDRWEQASEASLRFAEGQVTRW